jgi:carboxyl-terminal processing protease
VDASFYRELSEDERQQLVEDMINGGLRKLDPHSEYLNADQLKRFETDAQGSFGGVGIVLATDPATKFLKVDHPMPGTPAYDAGVLADDLIVKVGDKSTEGITVPEARKLITGEPDTKVTLTTRRAGRDPADREVTLTRARVAQHPVSGVRRRADDPSKWEWMADKASGIAYIRVSAFNELTTKEIKAPSRRPRGDGARALVLDLRENPGGLLERGGRGVRPVPRRRQDRHHPRPPRQGADVRGEEGRHDLPAGREEADRGAGERRQRQRQRDRGGRPAGPQAGGGDRRADLRQGERAEALRLPGDPPSAVKLTTETYWRPSGANIDRIRAGKDDPDQWGVRPDVEVPTSKEDKLRTEVEHLKAQWVAGKPDVVGPKPPPAPTPRGLDGKPLVDESKPYTDQPLNKALEVLRGKLNGVGVAPAGPRKLAPAVVG